MDDMLTLTHATERDIDLLLIEELKCSSTFVSWFLARINEKVGGHLSFEVSAVSHSRRRLYNRREIDITLSLDYPGGRTVILVENKLDTSEQPKQAESYRQEAAAMIAEGRASAVFIVLVCPNAYAQAAISFARKFDCVLSYEAVAEFLASRAKQEIAGEIGNRLNHRHDLIQQAITKARRGYEAVLLPRSRHSMPSILRR